MSQFPTDTYAEPRDIDVNTRANLGPLSRMAGVWTGQRGMDIKPKAEGPKQQAFIETIELQPIDPVTMHCCKMNGGLSSMIEPLDISAKGKQQCCTIKVIVLRRIVQSSVALKIVAFIDVRE